MVFQSQTAFYAQWFSSCIIILHCQMCKERVRELSWFFYSADNQHAALCEAVMFKYRIQHLLKKAASTCLWIAFPLLQTNVDIAFLTFVRRPQSQLQLLWGASKAWMGSDSAKTAYFNISNPLLGHSTKASECLGFWMTHFLWGRFFGVTSTLCLCVKDMCLGVFVS